ncbi:hypothetical protein J416_09569 [Gracilibacillus halophilus YIM-C55.5]|uniref:Antitoxin SocA-like Panacea domain-containing protein n=1 Tax=Gracilibacillus halophilus YIM-C55.5 TaxID=1308866 RepID=N4WUE3_9BACI|nr:type II toxin-antitoxin system antitoxin SocA domain-containing protein [Gracilibacillus halophilus]ENH96736.1 hypothetical protein J416_09569 [Gracilibacillus halophilus YIM-C55.5]
MSRSALIFASYLIKRGLDHPRNTKNGNMKLQKLLYFAQLVHLSKYKKVLFDDQINAYENGCIIENVMNSYYYNHSSFMVEAFSNHEDLSADESNTVNFVIDTFGSLSAEELSEINHTHHCWKKAYNRSYVHESYKEKKLSNVDLEDMKYDAQKIDDIIRSYHKFEENTEEVIVIDGTEFYYEPSEITIDDSMKKFLRQFVGCEEVFTVYRDSSQGVVVY